MKEVILICWELFVNLTEPILLFIILRTALEEKFRPQWTQIIGLVALAASTTIMNSLKLSYVSTACISLFLYVIYGKISFLCSLKKAGICAALMIFVILLSNTILTYVVILLPGVSAASTLTPTFARFVTTAIYIMLNVVFVAVLISFMKRKELNYPLFVYIGIFVLCALSVVALYLLIDVAFATEAAGIASPTCAIISMILLVLVISILILLI